VETRSRYDPKESEARFKALMIDLAMVIVAGLMLAFALGILVGRMMH
jgi:hypothetical protein